LQTLDVAGAPHDCLELHYAAETKAVPAGRNIELLSRYGSEQTNVELDRLGGSGWQTRKAKLKNRIREIAGELIQDRGRTDFTRRRNAGAAACL